MNTHEAETIERAAMMDLHDAADKNDIRELGLMGLTVGSWFVSVARNLPASAIVVNRTLGLGLNALAARLHLAVELGCRQIFTCTGVSVPGDPQHSYNNILKAGFKEDYIRQNYAPT
jgi:hypothetical protein